MMLEGEKKKRSPIYIICASSSVLFLVLKEKNRKAEEALEERGFIVNSHGHIWSRVAIIRPDYVMGC